MWHPAQTNLTILPVMLRRVSLYLTGDTSLLRYRAQPVNAVWGNSRCLLWEPYGTHTDTVRTSQETHHFSATEPNRLTLCGITVAVCCENRTEHTDTLCGQNTKLLTPEVDGIYVSF
jgi:hypothetical protein